MPFQALDKHIVAVPMTKDVELINLAITANAPIVFHATSATTTTNNNNACM